MVKDLILNTQKNIKKNKIKKLQDVFNSKNPLVTFSNKMKKSEVVAFAQDVMKEVRVSESLS